MLIVRYFKKRVIWGVFKSNNARLEIIHLLIARHWLRTYDHDANKNNKTNPKSSSETNFKYRLKK